MQSLKKAGKVFDIITAVFGGIAGLFVVAIMLIMCYEVVLRYFFNDSPTWALEITEYLLYMIAVLGAAWLLRHDGHVRVDLIATQLNDRNRMRLLLASSIIGAIICLAITWFGIISTIDVYVRGVPVVKTLAFPRYIVLMWLPIGFFLLAIQFIRNSYNTFCHLKAGIYEEEVKEEMRGY